MLLQMNAVNVAGFYNDKCFVDSELFVEYPEKLPEVERHLALIRHLGIPVQGRQLQFPLSVCDEDGLEHFKTLVGDRKYVCVHAGSRGSWRQWPPKYFAVLADDCAERGYVIVVTGTNEERDITRE